MPAPKLTKPKPLEASKTRTEKVNPLKVRTETGKSDSKGPSKRTVSCGPRGITGVGPISDSQRRTRASSTAPKLTPRSPVANLGDKKPSSRPTKQTTTSSQQRAHGHAQKQQLKHSHAAFTVIPPDPKKRLKIQKNAEAELTALEELRLSKAMAYVSISPSAVGGCLSLEEVRQKQQQEMKQTKRKTKQMTSAVVL